HEADSLRYRPDDLAVASLVAVRELQSLALLQPFLANPVAADVELPRRWRHALEILGRVNRNSTLRGCFALEVANLLDDILSFDGINGARRRTLFQQMQVDELLPTFAERAKQFSVHGQRQAREVVLQELSIASAVG